LLSVFVTAALVSLATPPVCVPSAQVVGPLEAPLAEALRRRDVRVPPAPGCPVLKVEVAAEGSGIAVRRPPAPAQRVPDLATAALLVETWVRAELIDPLLSARRPPPARPLRTERPFHVGGGFDVGVTDDRALWLGGRLHGCLQLGMFCPGVRLRTLFDAGEVGESQEAEVTRLSLGVLVTGDFVWGPLRTGVGVGATTVRVDSKTSRDDDIGGAPLLEAHIDYAFPLSEDWALEVDLAGDWALWPRRGRGRIRDSDFPGQSSWAVMGGLGVRWSGL